MTDTEKALTAEFLRGYRNTVGSPFIVLPHIASELRAAGITYGWVEQKMLPKVMVEGR